ncbi:MAG: hypothetical protein ACRDO0_06105 [Nocardioidaceae bacterium]
MSRRPMSRTAVSARAGLAGSVALVLLTLGCTGEPEPSLDQLGRTLAKDGSTLLEDAKVMAPAHYEGRITFLDRPGTRDVACEEQGAVKRVFEGHGVGEWGSGFPARLDTTTRTLAGILRPLGYEVDRYSEKSPRWRLWLSKAGGGLSFRVIVDDGEPMRWRAVGETRCVPSS